MRLHDIVLPDNTITGLTDINNRCEHFIEESRSLPLFKSLPITYDNVHKVKVRKRKSKTQFTETFNSAFQLQHYEIHQRAIFANGEAGYTCENVDTEPFYVFPTDGFRYMYSTEVQQSSDNYKHVMDGLVEAFGEDVGSETVAELLRFSYKTENLHEGVSNGCEIVIYDIPYYYAVRTTVFESYEQLMQMLRDINDS